jgi:hypothetical protein
MKIGESVGIKPRNESPPYNKTTGLYFSSATVRESSGIVLLLLEQITVFVLLCFGTKLMRALKSVFNNRFHFEFDLIGVVPNRFNNFLAPFTLSRRCVEVIFCKRVILQGFNPISSFNAL